MARVASLALPLLGTASLPLLGAVAPAPAEAGVYLTRDEALASAFPGATFEARRYAPPAALRKQIRERAKVRETPKLVSAHLAWRGDTLAGVAFFDTRNVRTMPGVFMVAIGPDTTVQRVEVLAFHEPTDYRPPARWLSLFRRRRLDDRLWPRRDIRNLAGATLTTQAVTESVRLSLAHYELVVAPDLIRDGTAREREAGAAPERRAGADVRR